MGFLQQLSGRRKTVVSVSTVSVVSTAMVALALTYQGEPTADVHLDDSGVWVTHGSSATIGRFNDSAQALDTTIVGGSPSVDVLQQGTQVLAFDPSLGTLSPVDVANSKLVGTAKLPSEAQVVLAGAAAGILDTDAGNLWVVPESGVASFDAEKTPVTAQKLGKGAVLTGALDGTIRVVDPAGKITTVTTSDKGGVEGASTSDLGGTNASDVLTATSVGSSLVVLDATTGKVRLPDGTWVAVDGEGAVLQQPSQASSTVAIGTSTGLVSQPLDGSKATTHAASGRAAAPVQVAGCTYGAWGGTGQVVRDCAGTERDLDKIIDGVDASSTLRYRVNRNVVVLNDLAAGTVWVAADEFQKVDDWELKIPQNAKGDPTDAEDDTPEQVDQPINAKRDKNHAPKAQDDKFGVRPGRSTVLPVLANDTDPDGDVMVATPTGNQPGNAHVAQAMNGDALVAVTDDDASGSSSFTYEVSDGRGGTDSATVRLAVSPWGDEKSPEQTGEPVLTLEKGATGRIKVLPYFRDPDGDDLYLSEATAKTKGDEVRFEADGTVEYRDAGTTTGRKAVTLLVADGLGGTVEGTLWVDVKAPGNQPPVAVGDHVQTRAGEPVTVSPLHNDSDPNGDTLRLASVASVPGAKITQTGDTFQFSAPKAGSYVFTYQVTDGPSSSTGVVRVDVVDPDGGEGSPIAVPDTALLPAGGQTLVGVLDNDTDPSGGVLVVQSVKVPENSGITVAVLAHSVLRITEVKHLDQPVSFEYTVSNGTRSATGQVRVIGVAAPNKLHPPNAVADEATVHVGDVVTIPVLANDTHPDGFALLLDPTLSQEPDAKLGTAFVSDTVVRFQAGSTPGTAYAIYKVRDKNDQVDSAQITIHVIGGDQNSPPKPPTLDARTLSGGSVTITVPLDGTDSDGDSVRLTGIGTPPTKGVAKVTNGTIVYTAGKQSTGTDTFTYTVEDARGLTATGAARVGIAPPPTSNQPPTAVDDVVQVRPGRALSVPVMANDSDPDGDRISLVRQAVEGNGVTAKVDGDRVAFQTPQDPGTYTVYYTIEDTAGARASAALVVQVSTTAPLKPPVARDDVLSGDDILGKTSVTVDVLANDDDPDGAASALSVSTASSTATVTADKKITVPLTEDPQTILYTVTDPDGLTGKAFVRVPAKQSTAPTLRSDVNLKVESNQPLTIDVRDVVLVADGKKASLTEESKVTAVNGSRVVKDTHTVVFTSDEDFVGQAYVNVEVTDGTGPDDPKGHKATLSIPVTVTTPKNLPPTWKGDPTVEAGTGDDTFATVDLAAAVDDPEDDALTFTVGAAPKGLTVKLDGSTLEVEASTDLAKGTALQVPVTVTDGHNAPVAHTATVKVVSSNRKPARATEDDVPKTHQGEKLSIPVLDNDFNPFEQDGKPLKIVDVTLETPGASEPTIQGDDVVLTPDADFVGTLRLRYTIADATNDPDRQVEGQINVTVQGRPDAPPKPEVVETRSKTVVLSWSPPSDNGDPIEYYTVQSTDGSFTQQCDTTTCTLENLVNDHTYTFTVTATNEVETSDASPESEPARPDQKPDAPAAPTLEFGDGELTITWENATYTDRSPIQSVNLQISPAPADGIVEQQGVTGTSYTWKGLTNGTAYEVQVQAVNSAPDPSDWGAWSAEETPAGKPAAPAKPGVERTSIGAQSQMKVSWAAPDDNGGDITGYDIQVLRGGTQTALVEAGASATSQTINVDANTTDYTFKVRAKNKATEKFGDADWSPASDAIRAFAKPSAVKSLTATATGANYKVALTWGAATASGLKANEIMYEYKACGTDWTSVGNGATSVTVTCPKNGQSYTYQVRAVPNVDGLDEDNAGDLASKDATPYGPPPSPSVSFSSMSGSGGSYTAHFTVSYKNTSGRTVTLSTNEGSPSSWTVDPDDSVTVSKTVTVSGLGYSDSTTLKATATNAAGSASDSAGSSTTEARPVPHAVVSKGDVVSSSSCSNDTCYKFKVTTSNFEDTGNQSYTCTTDYPGESNFSSGTFSFPANGTVQLYCYLGYASHDPHVWVVINGKSYDADKVVW